MKYTACFAHLRHKPIWSVGDSIKRGTVIGEMGSTGSSSAAHLHLAVIEGEEKELWHLIDMEENRKVAAHREIQWFIDEELFDFPIVITTSYNDLDYFHKRDKVHLAYDVVPEDRHRSRKHYDIHWNRSPFGTVLANNFDAGYGNYLLMGYEK